MGSSDFNSLPRGMRAEFSPLVMNTHPEMMNYLSGLLVVRASVRHPGANEYGMLCPRRQDTVVATYGGGIAALSKDWRVNLTTSLHVVKASALVDLAVFRRWGHVEAVQDTTYAAVSTPLVVRRGDVLRLWLHGFGYSFHAPEVRSRHDVLKLFLSGAAPLQTAPLRRGGPVAPWQDTPSAWMRAERK